MSKSKNGTIDQSFPYYSAGKEATLDKLNSDMKGLTSEQARQRKEQYGENKLPEQGKNKWWKLLWRQLKDFLVLILVIAAVISWFTGHMVDVYVIIGVIVVNVVIGFTQEFKAQKSVESLKSLIKHESRVLRDEKEKILPVNELVPGDVIQMEEGKSVPADARILKKKNLYAEEDSLTGESMPVEKQTEPLDKDTGLPDRNNMIFKGTHISRGSCTAVVTSTGEHTELGKIAQTLKDVEEKESEFRKKTGKLAKIMAIIAASTSVVVFAVGYFLREFAFDDILLVTIASLISSIPEGLPAVLSIVLAIGANRMAKQNAIIREFTATETAGSLNVVISDKTGTITRGILTVKEIFIPYENNYKVEGDGYKTKGKIKSGGKNIKAEENEQLKKVLQIASWCNDAGMQKSKKDKEPQVNGDPTEVALMILAEKSDIRVEDNNEIEEKTDDLPFNSEQKFRATRVSKKKGNDEIFFVGAPEKIMSLCSYYDSPDGKKEWDNDIEEMIQDKIEEMSKKSMRVIGSAWKEAQNDSGEVYEDDADNLVFAGLYGIIDPPRSEVKEAVQACKSAGMRVIMATGDHKQTAEAIAREVNILDGTEKSDDSTLVVTEGMMNVDDEKLDEYTRDVSVFARVSPDSKLRIAKSLQKKNKLIGMTGDGVNDAPALKVADVGFAMGQKGTEVARDASQIVLSDDNFASIVNAIKEGRIVFRNVRSTSFFLITTNFASALTLMSAIAIGFTYPLLPTQILWINLVTDGIMDISLATEPDHDDTMEHEPLKKGEPILNKQILPYLFIIVPVMVVLALLTFNHYIDQGVEKARTGVFLVVAMTQVFNAFNMRSLTKSAFEIGFFKNKWVIIAFFASVLLQIAALKLSFIQDLFHFQNLTWTDIIVITALSSSVFIFGEIYKYIRKKWMNR